MSVANNSKKAIIANPESQPKGPISNFQADTLNPNQAEEIDCDDIVKLFGPSLPPGTFFKGFVEVQSPFQLSVTAVYTAQTCLNPGRAKCSKLGNLQLEVVPQVEFVGP